MNGIALPQNGFYFESKTTDNVYYVKQIVGVFHLQNWTRACCEVRNG
jgi:hypothetical protein